MHAFARACCRLLAAIALAGPAVLVSAVAGDALMAKGMTDWSYQQIAWVYGHDAAVLDQGPEAAPIAGH